MKIILRIFYFVILIAPLSGLATVRVGLGKCEISPPIGTPSAGYADRNGQGMEGTHDPLLALSLFIDNGQKQVVFCSVDHLGFTYEMVQHVIRIVKSQAELAELEIFIASSHTHSGGGAYLNIPFFGEYLAGPFNQSVTDSYVEKTAEAILQSTQNPILAKIGIGYGQTNELTTYRGHWPKDVLPLRDVMILKITQLDDTPLAVLFNYPVHPTVLRGENRLFSADFVGYARDHVKSLLGCDLHAVYFNGAQGDILPLIVNEKNRFESCEYLGKSLASAVEKIWNATSTQASLEVSCQKEVYAFTPQATPFGLTLPLEIYESEMNLIVFNKLHAFLTIPGELSCLYDKEFKKTGKDLGYRHLSIFGLTNDAHGYIILPESWRHKTIESGLSFGGEWYGEQIWQLGVDLLKANQPGTF